MFFKSVLFLGRSKCPYTKKIKMYLKDRTKNFQYIESKNSGDKFKISLLEYKNFDYIFSFRSFFILKKELLKKCSIMAINFHPGPPEYRGVGCVNYAFFDNVKSYGCTAHRINQKIDNGPIIDVKRFKLDKKETIDSCLEKTHKLSYKQSIMIFKSILNKKNFLNESIKKNKTIKWSNKIKNKKDLEKFYQINLNLSKKNILRKIKSTYTKKFKPYIIYNKKRLFLYQINDI